MSAKDPRLYLIHIRECCERILDYTGGVETTWPSVPVVQDAVCRNLEIIGEAARRFDDEYRLAHAEIPWRAMTDVRNADLPNYFLDTSALAKRYPARSYRRTEWWFTFVSRGMARCFVNWRRSLHLGRPTDNQQGANSDGECSNGFRIWISW
jgi:uncharacterized protein with HEPN domain